MPQLSTLISTMPANLCKFRWCLKISLPKVVPAFSSFSYINIITILINIFFIIFIAANEDYIPISEILTFALVTNETQCVVIPVLNDPFVEEDEVFLLQSINANLTEITPQSVTITITNDDSNIL